MAAPPVQERLPIYLASLGPKNLDLTGELADGWLPIWVHQAKLPEFTEHVARAAARAGRQISEVTVAPQIVCYASEDAEELADAEQRVRAHMAYYIGGMGQYYYDLFCRSGFQAEADAVRDAWSSRQRDKAAAAVSDAMVENIAVLGDAETCRAKLQQFRRNGADMPVIAFPQGSSLTAVRRTLEALAPNPVPAAQPVS